MSKWNKRIAVIVMIALFAALALSGCMPASSGGIEAGGGEGAASGGIMGFLPLILIIVVFYFLLIRPQNKKNKQVATMRSSIKRGDMVTTIGGFIGRVVRIKDDVITIEVGSDKTKLDLQRWGISKIDEPAPEPKGTKARDEEPEEEEQPKRKPKKLTAAPKKELEDIVEEIEDVIDEAEEQYAPESEEEDSDKDK